LIQDQEYSTLDVDGKTFKINTDTHAVLQPDGRRQL